VITPKQISEKARRLYPQAVDAWLRQQCDTFFPRRIPADLKPDPAIAAAIRDVEVLRAGAKETRGRGYRIQWQGRQSRTLGRNDFPEGIYVDSLEDLVWLTRRQQEFARLAGAVAKLRSQQPELGAWLLEASNWKPLLEVAEALDDLLLVVGYFRQHPRPDCFARELPLPISTKLIQANARLLSAWLDRVLPPSTIDARYSRGEFEPRYGLRYVRPHFLLRILDPQLMAELGLPTSELSMPAEGIATLPAKSVRVFIVENKINLLTLPPTRRAIALGGLGNAVTQLSAIGWLHHADIFYWGDLDVEGFEILARLRRHFPQLKSLLMDEPTWITFQSLSIGGNVIGRALPERLTAEERCLCQRLAESQRRLEQERIPQSAVMAAFAQLERLLRQKEADVAT
jgi:hypothetical protein